jgi:prevent-host-death family protein
MAKRVSIGDAKARISALVNAVAFGGERFVIESRGHPKAALVPAAELAEAGNPRSIRPTKAQRALGLLQADRVRKSLEGLTLTESVTDLRRLRGARTRARR